ASALLADDSAAAAALEPFGGAAAVVESAMGHPDAQYIRAMLTLRRAGDDPEIWTLMEAAAEQGHKGAMLMLARHFCGSDAGDAAGAVGSAMRWWGRLNGS